MQRLTTGIGIVGVLMAFAGPAYGRGSVGFGPDWVDVAAEASGYDCGEVYLLSPDHLVIDDMELAVDASSRRGSRAACSHILDIANESGWTFAVGGIFTEVDADLWGPSALFKFSHHFQGERDGSGLEQEIDRSGTSYIYGPVDDVSLKPCDQDRALIVKTALQTRYSRYGYGEARLVGPVHIFLDWQQCH